MKLIEIRGKIWELTVLQSYPYTIDKNSVTQENIHSMIRGDTFRNGIGRTLASNGVKSRATAIIELTVNKLPQQYEYDKYHNSKGFFCKVKNKRVYLKELIE